jgi:Di-haem oxidoreductase, putative peroxidase
VVGSGSPSDTDLQTQRNVERGVSPALPGSGIFDVAVPPAGTVLKPAGRVPRDKYGVVGPLPLTLSDLDTLVFPGSTLSEKKALLEGLTFFTTPHPAADGAGAMANQPFCQGCHENVAEAVKSPGLLGPKCLLGSDCSSPAACAARSTPTNFEITSLDPVTGGGLAPDDVDAIFNTGKTAAFTTFGDFTLSIKDTAAGAIGCFDPLDGTVHNCVKLDGSPLSSPLPAQPFSGFVQHVRPSVDACLPKPIPPLVFDMNLTGENPNAFRRAVGERAGPPYLGRGLMEAVPNNDILANTDPVHSNGTHSTLGDFTQALGCSSAGCISGKSNMIPPTAAFVPAAGSTPARPPGLGRFGLRANGVEILQFVVGGAQGEVGITSALNLSEIPLPKLFPGGNSEIDEPDACKNSPEGGHPSSDATSDEAFLSAIFSTRSLIRNIATPEFGDALLDLLQSSDPAKPRHGNSQEAKVQRGAELFGIDLVAFANRTVRSSGITATGDGRDLNAINQADRKLNCVGCHTPIHRTGQSPAATSIAADTTEVGAAHLSNVWAPIFSDLLLHKGPVIDAERFSPRPRDVVVISRFSAKVSKRGDDKDDESDRDDNSGRGKRRILDTFDLPRSLADDTFNGQKGAAEGSEFRTTPLMALGRIGPPFLHDGRVYLSKLTVNSTPAGTVTTNRKVTNAPLVVRTLDDALLAAIELHDLPAPDDKNTPKTPGAGCPVPDEVTNVSYGLSRKDAEDAICPPYGKDPLVTHSTRSDSREVIRRFRELSVEDQQAVIEFLKQL